MIKNKVFELLVNEINRIEAQIAEVKVLECFYEARIFESILKEIADGAKNIFQDEEPDDNSQAIPYLKELLELASDIDYFLMKATNFIESVSIEVNDYEAVEEIKIKWKAIEKALSDWNTSYHNPIEKIEKEKEISLKIIDIIIEQISVEGILDLTKAIKLVTADSIVGSLKIILFDGAEKCLDESLKLKYIGLAKSITKDDLLDYKLWLDIMQIKGMSAKSSHIEIVYNPSYKKDISIFQQEDVDDQEQDALALIETKPYMGMLYDLRNKFNQYVEMNHQMRMDKNWGVPGKTPSFKNYLIDDTVNYEVDFITKKIVENTKKLKVATPTLCKYNFENGAIWYYLEEVEFFDRKTRTKRSKSDRSYSYIGSDTFANCEALKNINFGMVELIGERAFKNCPELRKVVFSNNIKSVGKDAFADCINLVSVEFVDDLETYILERPQTILNCFKGTSVKEILFPRLETSDVYSIVDCPTLEDIFVNNIACMSIPFKTCKYVLGEKEGIVSFVSRKALEMWKDKNKGIRFFELTDEDIEHFDIKHKNINKAGV